jgi:7,8-dihydroneopterin aldolase/epimerase/oxygenase
MKLTSSQAMGQTDKILISRIDCVASIGVTPEERTIKQRLSIDLEFSADAARAAQNDSLKDAVDYSRVAAVVMQVCQSRPFHLIETVAEHVAARVLADFPIIQVRVLVRKLSPVVEPRVEYVSVEILRTARGRNPL